MKIEVNIAGTERTVEIERESSGRLRIRLDGAPVDVDAVEIGANTYSILLNGHSFDARVHPTPQGLSIRCDGQEFPVEVRDPRAWRGQRRELKTAEGRQQVVSPMPGKVVRVLVASGETVESRQGLLVVEAMKMQNEIRAPKGGHVERVLVAEGQTVAAGQPLVIIA
jgi:biotin carboxyl carrier protein